MGSVHSSVNAVSHAHASSALVLKKVSWAVFVQHPVLRSLNIEHIELGEGGARGLAAAVKRGLPLDGVSAYGAMGMIGA